MTPTEAAINERASQLASSNYFDDAKLAKALRDALILYPDAQSEDTKRKHANVTRFLALFRAGSPHAIGALEDMGAEQMVDDAELDALREREKPIPQLPDCDGCRVDLAGEVECCQEKP